MRPARPMTPALPAGTHLVDSHCHLDMDEYAADLPAVLERAIAHGVTGIVTVGIDRDSSLAALDLARSHRCIRACVGIHPHHADQVGPRDLEDLAALIETHRDLVVGFGEIGLDFAKQYASIGNQHALFARQVQVAKELRLPVIIHDRDAHEECLQILQDQGPLDHGGVMHCFSGDMDLARRAIDLNLHISLPGIVTFKNAVNLHDVAARLPLDRLLLETDGPFLAPAPFRGKRNEPLYLIHTAQAVARLRDQDLEEIARQTTDNCRQLFGYDFSRGRTASP